MRMVQRRIPILSHNELNGHLEKTNVAVCSSFQDFLNEAFVLQGQLLWLCTVQQLVSKISNKIFS